MRRYRVTVDGRVYEVEIEDPRARPVTARIEGVAYAVEVETGQGEGARAEEAAAGAEAAAPAAGTDPAAAAAPAADGAAAASAPETAHDSQVITAPIPGVVASVVANVGQVVKRGDELLTLEAMKMFNVLRSPRAGTVATLHVAEGERVLQGQPLVTFGPR